MINCNYCLIQFYTLLGNQVFNIPLCTENYLGPDYDSAKLKADNVFGITLYLLLDQKKKTVSLGPT